VRGLVAVRTFLGRRHVLTCLGTCLDLLDLTCARGEGARRDEVGDSEVETARAPS
jgi:hypothetical protein